MKVSVCEEVELSSLESNKLRVWLIKQVWTRSNVDLFMNEARNVNLILEYHVSCGSN